jgi:acetyltransferase-like isoleucine patch superfamily enzyme
MSRLARGLRELVAAPWLMLVRHLPGPLGIELRRLYWGRRLAALGPGVRIDEGVHIVNPEHVWIGSGCWIAANVFLGAGPPSTEDRDILRRANPGFGAREGDVRIADDVYLAPATLINGHGGVEIGANVSFGPAAKVYSSSHHYRGPDSPVGEGSAASGMRRGPSEQIGRQSLALGPVVIGPEAFVGSNAIVMPGVSLGPASWLGAGAVAHRDLEPGRVYRAPDPIAIEPVEAAGRSDTA